MIELLFTHRPGVCVMRLGYQVSHFSHPHGRGRSECGVIWVIETWMIGIATGEVFRRRYYVLLGPLWHQNW
jgi:hypothetical protein